MGGAPPLEATRLKKRWRRYLGRYELIGELARGGMGTVYLARHGGEAGFQRLFAIKVMHPHLAAETDFVDMLRDEARIAARIHHPNVVSIVDLGTLEDIHYVVMEYVEGPSLGTLLKRTGDRVSPAHVVAVMIDALEGLHAAHTLTNDEGEHLQLVHRDISPQNILVGADGGGRITDFGVAKAETRISSTRPGVRKGKLAFMAPEQIKEGDNIDLRADIWAAGVVLWTALTGRHLFKGENDAATVLGLLTKDVPPPSTEGWKAPAAFDEVVLRALNRDPAQRFGSALEMAEALRKVADESGHHCSNHDVARWVTEVFGEELRLRRQAIRDVAQGRDEGERFSDTSQIGTLPALPTMSSGPFASPDPITSSPHQFGPGGTGSFARTVVDPNIGSVSSPSQLGYPTLAASPIKRRLWTVIAVLGVLLVVAATLLIRTPSGVDQKSAAPSSGVALSGAVPSAAALEQPKDTPSANAALSATETDGDSGKSNIEQNATPKRPPRFRPHIGRPAVQRPVPESPASAKAAPPPTDQAGKTRLPQATGTSPALEKNPYVRR